MAESVVEPIVWENQIEKKEKIDYNKSKNKRRKKKLKKNKVIVLKDLKSKNFYVQSLESYYLLEYKFIPKHWSYHNFQRFIIL
jgi:hypothetical protein